MFISKILISNFRVLGSLYDIHRRVMAFAGSGKRVLYRVEEDVSGVLVLTDDFPRGGVDWGKVVAVKEYCPVVGVGDEYCFRLLANPTRVVSCGGGKSLRCILSWEDQRSWLLRKGVDAGFEVLGVSVVDKGFCRVRKPSREWNCRAVLFDGVLRVVDEGLFSGCLFNGIGRGKAFGFGLLSVARVSSRVLEC
jgi:CRISPR system Cascade subunit CasE